MEKLSEDLHHFKPRPPVILEDNMIKRKAKTLDKNAKDFWNRNKVFLDNL